MNQPIEDLRAQANSYNFFASFFRSIPTTEWFEAALEFVSSWTGESVEDVVSELSKRVKKESQDEYIPSLQQEYERLFFAPGRVLVNLYESVYRDNGLLMQDTTINVRRHYLRAGLVVKALHTIPDDHVATELEFMEFLTRGILSKVENNCFSKEIQELEAWRSEFLSDHLRTWIPALAKNIRTNTTDLFFHLISIGLESLIED